MKSLNFEYIYLRITDLLLGLDPILILNKIIRILEGLMPLALGIGLFLIYLIIYSKIKFNKIVKEEELKFHAIRVKDINPEKVLPVENKRWQKVEAHINSANPSDWRLAILEADIMLGDLLEKSGYQGDSIGEKLKGVEKSDFVTLDLAWEAHKVRNEIAHKGAEYQLNDRDARRVIELYKKVFQEFEYI